MLIISSILAGCGGGGGSSSSEPAKPNSIKVAISEANKKQVATAVLQSNVRSLSAFGENAIGVVRADATARTGWDLIKFTKVTLESNSFVSRGQSELPVAIIKQGAIACGDETSPSGSISIEFDDTDSNGEYSVGDSVQFTFNDCFDSSNGKATIGKIKFVFRSVSGLPTKHIAPWSIAAKLTYSGLQVRDSNRILIDVNGTMLWSQNQKNTDDSSVAISDASLIVTVTGKEFVITDCVVSFDENNKTGAYTQFGRQTITSRELGGVLVTETSASQALIGTYGNAPTSGVIQVLGEKSSLFLSATGNGSVKIELDSNSDGVVESSETVDWATLV